MWRSFSLRTRICLSLLILFLFVALAAVLLLRGFASEQFVAENTPGAESAALIASALNNAVNSSPEPYCVLDAFAATLKPKHGMAITFRPVVTDDPEHRPPATAEDRDNKRAPAWFVHFLDLPDIRRQYPVSIGGQRVGDILFDPALEADIHEKWIGFLAIMTAGLGLALVTIVTAYLTIGSALRPLKNLGLGLARLRAGNHGEPIRPEGPPEIASSCVAANDLGSTLEAIHRENASLLRKMVSIQDDERRGIARELHDELGSLLFSIRANAIAMVDTGPDGRQVAALRMMASVEALQTANRRILDRLRPHYIDELGLLSSIDTLVQNTRSQCPELIIRPEIDPSIAAVDAIAAQTIYRVLQESMTNVLRHAVANSVTLRATITDDWATVEVQDDGIGLRSDFAMGRGLTGMRERVRALGGDFDIARIDDMTCLRCRIPALQTD